MKQKKGPSPIVTTAYLDKALNERFAESEVRTDLKLENLERKIDEKARLYRDELLTSNDKLAKTLETMREELEIGNFQLKGQVIDHEKRIKVLESA